MSKIKIGRKDKKIIAKTKLGRSESINQKEMAVFGTKCIRGLMRPEMINDKKINYSAADGILLEKYLKRGIDKNDFFLIVAHINEMLKKMEYFKLSLNNLLVDFKYIFINENTKEVNFIYQPILGSLTNVSMFNFIYDVMSCAKFKKGEDIQTIHAFNDMLGRMQFFSTAEFEKCILKVYPEVYKQVHREEFGQGTGGKGNVSEQETGLLSNNYAERETGLLISNDYVETGVLMRDAYSETSVLENDDYGEQESGLVKNNDYTYHETEVLDDDDDDDYDYTETGILMDDGYAETGILMDDGQEECNGYNETMVLQPTIEPYLIRESTGEKIAIFKSEFKLGRDKLRMDYVINNGTVSGMHATILKKDTAVFVKDQSTNGTRVDGRKIPKNKEIELIDGCELVFSNEVFRFYIR